MADQTVSGTPATPAAPPVTPPNDPKAGGTGTGKAGESTATPAAEPGDTSLVSEAAPGDGQTPAKPADGKGAETKPQGAPEKYEFKMPEGFEADPQSLQTFTEKAKSWNLPQNVAQELMDFHTQQITQAQEQQKASFDTMKKTWRDDSLKALGPQSKEKLAIVARGRDWAGDSDLIKLLDDSGFGNHPAVVKLFLKVGEAISEDNLAEGKTAGGDKSIAERVYPSATKK